MSKRLTPRLGAGLYSIGEAANYAKVPPRMIARWLFGSGNGKAVVKPEFGAADRRISFLDFVQTVAIREIRLQQPRVPLAKIRQAIEYARSRHGIDFPFARQNCTFLNGDELVIAPNDGEYVEASGRRRGQRLFRFVELYLKNLSFDPDGLANLYTIFRSGDVAIRMDPAVRFGEPLLPSGYTALAIWESILAEGGIEQAAKANGIPRKEADAAYKFYVDHLGKAAA